MIWVLNLLATVTLAVSGGDDGWHARFTLDHCYVRCPECCTFDD